MYILDYFIKTEEALVPDKRTPKMVAFNKALVTEIDNLHTQTFGTYKDFQSLPLWVAGSYNERQLVRYGKSVFQSNINNNTSTPTFTNDWNLVSANFLGTDFRLRIKSEKIIFEYALNTWFETTGIYIETNNNIFTPVFRVGFTDFESSSVRTNGSNEFVQNAYTFGNQFNYIIKVPTAFYDTLGATNQIKDSIIRSFADKYNASGLIYTIENY